MWCHIMVMKFVVSYEECV